MSDRYAVIVSRFNEVVTRELLSGAEQCFGTRVPDADIDVYWVPGAWELPAAAQSAAMSGRYRGIVALGCVIRGETPHFDFVAAQAAEGLMRVGLEQRIPIGFGVLTTDNLEQAMARAGGRGSNKGFDAALVALEMAEVMERIGRGAGA